MIEMNEQWLPKQHGWVSQTLLATKPDLKEYMLYGFIHMKFKKVIFNYRFTNKIVERKEKVVTGGVYKGKGILGCSQYSGPGLVILHWAVYLCVL